MGKQETKKSVVKKKILKIIEEDTIYNGCTFYPEQATASINNSEFYNCSFRSVLSIRECTGSVFDSCNFSDGIQCFLSHGMYHNIPIPNSIANHVTLLTLSFNMIQNEQQLYILRNMPDLQYLNLRGNHLFKFPQIVINHCKKLKYLSLRGNDIHPYSLDGLDNSEKFLKEVSKMEDLESIDIGGIKFRVLPKFLSYIPNLKRIYVSEEAYYSELVLAQLQSYHSNCEVKYSGESSTSTQEKLIMGGDEK